MFPADALAEFRLVMERLDAGADSGASGCRALQESVLEAASDLLKRSLRSFSPPPDSTRSVARQLARELARMLIDQLRPATLEEISIPEVPRLGHSAVCRRGRSLEPLQMPMESASEPEVSESLQNQVNAPHGRIERELSRHTHLLRGSQTWLVSKLTEAAGPEVESVAFRFPEVVVQPPDQQVDQERYARIAKFLERVNRFNGPDRPGRDGSPERATKKTIAEALGYSDHSPIMRWQRGQEKNFKIEGLLPLSAAKFWKSVITHRNRSRPAARS
jgi:hypothetical protein